MPTTTATAAAAANNRRGGNFLESSRRRADGVRFVEESSARNAFYEDTDDSEEEEERRLSEQHGEAEEGSGRGSKRVKDDAEIEAEYKGKDPKKKRTPRPTLTAERLTGSSDGLIRISTEFPRLLPKLAKTASISSTAAYSRALMTAYNDVCSDLWPGQHPQDVMLKIEQLGAKQSVKEYLKSQRQNVCRNRYLEKVLGREKAEALLQQLEEYTTAAQQQKVTDEEQLYGSAAAPLETPATTRATTAAQISPHGVTATSNEQQDEEEATFEEETADDVAKDDTEESRLLQEMQAQVAAEVAAKRNRKRILLEDSDDDDEVEADFEDTVDSGALDVSKDVTKRRDDAGSAIGDDPDKSEPPGVEAKDTTLETIDAGALCHEPLMAEPQMDDMDETAAADCCTRNEMEVPLNVETQTERTATDSGDCDTNNVNHVLDTADDDDAPLGQPSQASSLTTPPPQRSSHNEPTAASTSACSVATIIPTLTAVESTSPMEESTTTSPDRVASPKTTAAMETSSSSDEEVATLVPTQSGTAPSQ